MKTPFATIKRTATEDSITIHANGGNQVMNLAGMTKEDRSKHTQYLSDVYFKEGFK